MRVLSAVRPQEFESGKAVADFIEHERGSMTILDASRMNDDRQWLTLRVDQGMNFAPLHFLAGAIPGQTVMTATSFRNTTPCKQPFSVPGTTDAAFGYRGARSNFLDN